MKKEEKIMFAKKEIAEKWKCDPAIFDYSDNVFYESKDTFFEIITFGTNAVIRADASILDWCSEKFKSVLARDIMDGDNLYDIGTKLRSLGKKLGGEHIGYLHLFPEKTVQKPEGFVFRSYIRDEINEIFDKHHEIFDNAFSPDKDRNILAIAAYDKNEIVALAGCDDYLGSLWQIGIDTASSHRNRGLGAYLVKEITHEIERHKKVAYYNTWSPNIASTKLALSTGFYPAWVSYPSEEV